MRIFLYNTFLLLFYSMTCLSQEKLIVYFELDSYVLDSNFRNKIDSLLQKNPIEHIRIEAHCDILGNDQYNDVLSLKRAIEVKNYLLVKGININEMSAKGLGKRMLLNKNRNEKERNLNRRAEIFYSVKNTNVSLISDTVVENITTIVENIYKSKPDVFEKDSTFNIDNIEVGSTFVLKNINFYGGRHVLLPQSYQTLPLLLTIMKTHPTLVVEIQGHICCIENGKDGIDNDTGERLLSVNRAKMVYEYLKDNGIRKSRMSYKGFASLYKLAPETTEEGKMLNRRVEIKILQK